MGINEVGPVKQLSSAHGPLRPLAQKTHEGHAQDEAQTGEEDGQHVGVCQLSLVAVATDHPVGSPHLDDADPDEDAGGEGIESANGDEGGPVVAVEILQDTDADGHADGGDEGEEGGEAELLLHGQADWSNGSRHADGGFVGGVALVGVSVVV